MTSLTPRDNFLAALNHEKPETIPFQWMSFWNDRSRKKFLPPDCIEPSANLVDRPELQNGPRTAEAMERIVRYNNFVGSSTAGVGLDGNQSFGHGGPGELYYRIIDRGPGYLLLEYESGARRIIRDRPHSVEFVHYPIQNKEDLERVKLPNLDDPDRFRGIKEEADFYKQNGLFTTGSIMGFFAGAHNNFYNFEDFMADLLLDPDFARRLIGLIAEYNLKAAGKLLECGIDCINLCDDLGSGTSLIMSPELYRKFFLPHHRDLCELCHSAGGYAQLHSHGNVNEIMDDIVAAGFDIINPLDPAELMDLTHLKELYGGKITLAGGITWDFYLKPEAELERIIERVCRIGRPGGGFVLMDAGGIPAEMTVDKFRFYLETTRRCREAS